ncbi:hypothetical protein [uncultured Xylophilus sp.]|uniref:hypothetical protein n=1 Tax=uncultured Xylophilus sp. TaxID=296832 RepID=UPI0025F2F76A|nr:hypothetical protein [uncultured Xylophilus sp.]
MPALIDHNDVAHEFTSVIALDQCLELDGGRCFTGGWSDYRFVGYVPPASAPAPGVTVTVTPPEFKLLFTAPERIAIKRIRASTDPEQQNLSDAFDDFFDILDDPRLTHVNLSLASTQAGIAQVLTVLHGLGVVEDIEARTAAILSGVLQ